MSKSGLGKILGSVSPAFGIASGKGLFGNSDLLGSISPLYGMVSGKGLFGGSFGGSQHSDDNREEMTVPGAPKSPNTSSSDVNNLLGGLFMHLLGR